MPSRSESIGCSQAGRPQPVPQPGVSVTHIAYAVDIGIKLLIVGNNRAVISCIENAVLVSISINRSAINCCCRCRHDRSCRRDTYIFIILAIAVVIDAVAGLRGRCSCLAGGLSAGHTGRCLIACCARARQEAACYCHIAFINCAIAVIIYRRHSCHQQPPECPSGRRSRCRHAGRCRIARCARARQEAACNCHIAFINCAIAVIYLSRYRCHRQPLEFPSGRRSRMPATQVEALPAASRPRQEAACYRRVSLHQLRHCSYHLCRYKCHRLAVGVPVWQAVSVPATQVEAALPCCAGSRQEAACYCHIAFINCAIAVIIYAVTAVISSRRSSRLAGSLSACYTGRCLHSLLRTPRQEAACFRHIAFINCAIAVIIYPVAAVICSPPVCPSGRQSQCLPRRSMPDCLLRSAPGRKQLVTAT